MTPVQDDFTVQSGGMQSGLDPSLVPQAAFVKGINVSIRGGLAKTRGGFEQITSLGAGVYQGGGIWSLNDADRFVYIMDGYLHVWNLTWGFEEASSVVDPLLVPVVATPPYLHSSGTRLATTVNRCVFTQIDRYLSIQDGVHQAVVLDIVGAIGYVAYVANFYVPGTIGAYAHGRYHYSPTLQPLLAPAVTLDSASYDVVPDLSTVTGRPYFVSSDVLDTLNPEYVLRMAEHRIAAMGGALALPQEFGFITAMSTIRGAASGTGVGELLVFARNGVSAFDVSIDRAQWHKSAISKTLFTGAGTLSPFSPCPVNDDVAYIDRVGQLRLLRYDKTRLAGSGGSLSNTPMSNEIQYFINLDDRSELTSVSLVGANNRINWTMLGETTHTFKALGSLDLALSYAMSGVRAVPAYDGVWTGFHFGQLLSADAVMLAVVLREGSWLLLEHSDDALFDLATTPVQATLVTRGMNFKNQADLKTLQYAELWLKDVATPVDVEVFYRPNGYNTWTSMGAKHLNAPAAGSAQYRRRLKFAVDTSVVVCNPIDQKVLWDSAEFQFAIRWSGSCGVDYFRATADLHDEMTPEACDAGNDNPDNVALSLDEGLDDFDYWV